MNSKFIVGTLVGGVILFLWQFLSWTMLNLHGDGQKYTAKQTEILQYLGENLEGEGSYFLPTYAPGTSQEDMEKLMASMDGKPWATISYHSAMNANMGLNMFRGLVIDFVAIAMLIWLLLRFANLGMKDAIMASLVVGLISYFTSQYTYSIWFETNTIPDLIDTVVSWALVGGWLGFWLPRQ